MKNLFKYAAIIFALAFVYNPSRAMESEELKEALMGPAIAPETGELTPEELKQLEEGPALIAAEKETLSPEERVLTPEELKQLEEEPAFVATETVAGKGGTVLRKYQYISINNNTGSAISSPGFIGELGSAKKGFRLDPYTISIVVYPEYNKPLPLSLSLRNENLGRETDIDNIIIKENSIIRINELQDESPGAGIKLHVINDGEEQIIERPWQ